MTPAERLKLKTRQSLNKVESADTSTGPWEGRDLSRANYEADKELLASHPELFPESAQNPQHAQNRRQVLEAIDSENYSIAETIGEVAYYGSTVERASEASHLDAIFAPPAPASTKHGQPPAPPSQPADTTDDVVAPAAKGSRGSWRDRARQKQQQRSVADGTQ